jgi:hypothetical protein
MKLAFDHGFSVRVVPLPPGRDPADAPDEFEQHLAAAVPLARYWVQVETERALPDKGAAFARARTVLGQFDESPERQDAVRYLADRLGLSRELQAGLAPRASRETGVVSPKLLEAGDHLERSALAGVAVHPSLRRVLAELGPEHFDAVLHRRARSHLLGEEPADDELVRLLAELDARADAEGIDEDTAEQLLLRLRERRLARDLAEADAERLVDLQQKLASVRDAIREYA